MSMSLTQSICYISSGTNLSNLSYDRVVPPKFWVIHVCVSARSQQPHIILHYSDSALSLMLLHIWSCVHVFFLDFKSLIKCQTICNHFPPSSPALTTVDQGHLTVRHARSRALPPLSCTISACLCVVEFYSMARHVHLTWSQGQKLGVRIAKSYFPKPTRPHTHVHGCTHTHTAIPCRRVWPQSQTGFLSSVWTHICFLTTIIATDRAGRGPAYRCLLFDSHEETTWWWPRSVKIQLFYCIYFFTR